MERRTLKDTMHIEFNGKEIPVFGLEGLEKVDIENIIQSGINEKVLEGILCRSCDLTKLTELLVTEGYVYVKCIGVPLKKVMEQDNMSDRTVTIFYENGREVKYKERDAVFNTKLFYALKDLGEELNRRVNNHDRLWDGVEIKDEAKRREPEAGIPLEENEMPKMVVKYLGFNIHILIETMKDIHIEWIGEDRELRTKHGFVKLKDSQYIVQHQDKTIEVFDEEEFNECYAEHTKWYFLENGRAQSAVNPQGIYVFGGVIGRKDVIKIEEELKEGKGMTKEQEKIFMESDLIKEINNAPQVEMGTGMKIDLGNIALRNNDKLNGGVDAPKTHLGIGGGSIYSDKFEAKALRIGRSPYRILPDGNELEGYKIFSEEKNKVVATVYVKTMAMRMVGELNEEAATELRKAIHNDDVMRYALKEKEKTEDNPSSEQDEIKPFHTISVPEDLWLSLTSKGIEYLFNEELIKCDKLEQNHPRMSVQHLVHSTMRDGYVLEQHGMRKIKVDAKWQTEKDKKFYKVEFFDITNSYFVFKEGNL